MLSGKAVRLRGLPAVVQPTSKARFAIFESEQGFTPSLPLTPLYENDVLIAFEVQGFGTSS